MACSEGSNARRPRDRLTDDPAPASLDSDARRKLMVAPAWNCGPFGRGGGRHMASPNMRDIGKKAVVLVPRGHSRMMDAEGSRPEMWQWKAFKELGMCSNFDAKRP